MADNTTSDTEESSFAPELERQISEIQANSMLSNGPVHDLDEHQKIWLVIGICLHNIITPILRKYVESVMTSLYTSLVKSDQINTQTYPAHLRGHPHQGVHIYYLNYDCINNNKALGRQNHLYDYKVQNGVDLSKLFLLSNMTHYNGFDDTCDASVLLGLVKNVDGFHPGVKATAACIRSDIRNPWAHCDFTQWNSTRYSLSFRLMENLIKNLGLSSSDKKQTLGQLIMWKTNGVSFLSGTTLGLEHVKEIHEETCVLAKHAQVLSLHCKEIDMQIVDVNNTLDEWYNILQVLTDMKTKFEDKISSLEKHVFEMNSQIEQQNKRMKEMEKNMEHCMCFSREVQAFSLAMQAQLLEIGDRKVSLLTEQKECIPENIRAQHDQYLKEWIKDDTLFVNTRAAKYSLSSLQSNNCLLVTGSSGTGKSFIVHHIALHLFQKDGYEIIPFVTGPSDIIHYYDPKRKQVFVVDDICGKESINIQIIELWKSYYSNLEKIFLPSRKTSRSKDVFQDTKLLISCRLLIAKDKQFRNIELFTRNECNLLSSNMCLLPQERLQMIQKYLPEEMIHYVESILENFDFFPLLCCLSKNKTSEELVKLFSSPIEIIKSDVNNIHLQNKFQFCALVLCVLFREGFSEKWVQSKLMPEENKFKIYEIINQLSIDVTIESSRKSLVEGFTILEGTYLKKEVQAIELFMIKYTLLYQ